MHLLNSGKFAIIDLNSAYYGENTKVFIGIDKEKSKKKVIVKLFKNGNNLNCEKNLMNFKSENISKLLAEDEFVKGKSLPKKVLILEYCNGPSVHNLSLQNGLNDVDFLLLLECLYQSSKCLRSNHIFHANLSTRNILLHTENNGRKLFKLIDFGYCQTFEKEDDLFDLPTRGPAEYLPNHLFSEWILNKKYNNKQACYTADLDLWMIGITLFFAATGKYPFQPFNYQEFDSSHPDILPCHVTWFEMMQSKKVDDLWISQDDDNQSGFVHHSSLPDDCNLSKCLQMYTETLLYFLFNLKDTQNNYKLFFEECEKLLSMCTVNLYHVLDNSMDRLYLPIMSWNCLESICTLLDKNILLDSSDQEDNLIVMAANARQCVTSSSLATELKHILPICPALQPFPEGRGGDQIPNLIYFQLSIKEEEEQEQMKENNKLFTKEIPPPDFSSPPHCQMTLYICQLKQLFDFAQMELKWTLGNELVFALAEKFAEETKTIGKMTERLLDISRTIIQMSDGSNSAALIQNLHKCYELKKWYDIYEDQLLSARGLVRWKEECLGEQKSNKNNQLKRQLIFNLLESTCSIVQNYPENLDNQCQNNPSQLESDLLTCYENVLEAEKLYNFICHEEDANVKRLSKWFKSVGEIYTKLTDFKKRVNEMDLKIRDLLSPSCTLKEFNKDLFVTNSVEEMNVLKQCAVLFEKEVGNLQKLLIE